MGLFGGGARKREKEQLKQGWRGRLNAELWNEGEDHEPYFEATGEIELEFAHAALARKLGDPLSRDAAALATKLMPVTGAQGISPLEDGVRTAYLASYGETWDELDGEQVRVTARKCCEAASRHGTPEADNGRMRAGTAILGLVGNHPDHPNHFESFCPLYDYVAAQGSHERLTAAGAHFATRTVEAFGPYFVGDSADKPMAERCYRLAWHLGLSIWIWQECGFLKNPALEPAHSPLTEDYA